jgi:hypothetical protein
MFKNALRLATGSLLMSAAMCSFAADTTPQDFTVSGVFQELLGPSLRCPTKFGGTMTGYGTSDKLGRLVFLGGDCIAQSNNLMTFSGGHFIITTLTGELLFADYSGQAVPDAQGVLTFTGATFQITGGTGKYKHATGGGSMNGSESMQTLQGQIQLSGRILLKKD